MSLRFITGRAGSGKTTLCLKEINYMQEKGVTDTLIYIVPEQFSLQAERDLIAYGKSGTIMQAQVLSFNRLAYTVFGETGLSKKDALTDIGRDMLVKKTVNQTAEKLLYFKKAADKISFSQQTSRAITEFFKYGITEETLLSNAKKQKEDSVLAQKLNDMATIYFKYKENIENTFNSSDETLDVLYTKIDNSKIIKNAGGVITHPYGSVVRSLLVAIIELGVEEVMVIGHTDCGVQGMDGGKLLEELTHRGVSQEHINIVRNSGIDLEKWLGGFECVEQSVRDTVIALKNHTLMPKDITITGFIMDSVTGELRQVPVEE